MNRKGEPSVKNLLKYMFSEIGSPAGLSYFRVYGLVGTPNTKMYVHMQ